MRNLAIDERVVVGESDRPVVGAANATSDLAQPDAQRRVVVDPCVPRDPSVRPVRAGRLVDGPIGSCRHDDRSSPGNRAVRIGRTFRVAIGERHAGVESGRLALGERRTGAIEYSGRRDTHMLYSVFARELDDVLPGRHRFRAAHRTSVRSHVDRLVHRHGSAARKNRAALRFCDGVVDVVGCDDRVPAGAHTFRDRAVGHDDLALTERVPTIGH